MQTSGFGPASGPPRYPVLRPAALCRAPRDPSIVTVTEAQLDAPGPSFRHEALLYFSDAHFADRVGGFVRAGVVRATTA